MVSPLMATDCFLMAGVVETGSPRARRPWLWLGSAPSTVVKMDFRSESVVGLAQRVRQGELSAGSLVEHALDQIAQHNPTINAFVAVDEDRARAGAEAVDARIAAGLDPGPLAG